MNRKNNLSKALPIVAAHYGEKFGVKVVIGSLGASTDGDTIYVPNVPETYTNKNVVWGYLVHEAAHVRYTDFSVWNAVASSESLRKKLLNILEDIRIEYAMLNQFPGVRSDLDATVTYLKETGIMQEVAGTDEPGRVFLAKISYWLRANVLQQPVGNCSRSAEIAMQDNFSQGVITRLAVLLRKVAGTGTTADCLELTDKILLMLNEEAEKEEEKSKGEQSSSEDSSCDGDNDEQGCSESQQENQEVQDCAQQIRKVLGSVDKDLDQDPFEALKAELFEEAALHGDVSYRSVPIAPRTLGDQREGEELFKQVGSATSKLKSKLMGLVQASRRNRDFARRTGRKLYTKKITRILTGDTRIFKKRGDKVQANTAVHILTDLSGSMDGNGEVIAREASLAIALALEAIPGVSPAVTYFCGSSNDPVRSAVRHGESVKRNVSHFVENARGTTPMAEGLWHAAFELSKMGEDRKLMIVITDGSPDNASACDTVIELCDSAGIETVGIGICHQQVEDLFDCSIVINSVDELRNTLFLLMRDKLTVKEV